MERNDYVTQGKLLSRLFSIDLTIKVFGITIVSYHFPPKQTPYAD